MNRTIRPATVEEQMYATRQSQQICGQTGCIGILLADLDKDGSCFISTWVDQMDYLKTNKFKDDFENVINTLRLDKSTETPLKNRTTLAAYCEKYPEARIQGDENRFCFRLDTDDYSMLFRCDPRTGQDNISCYCYRRDWLSQHIEVARKGVRFIDTNYTELFRVKDGGKVRLTYPDGITKELVCRYIDDYHLQIGHERANLFHICEFAEKMEVDHIKCEPVYDSQPQRQMPVAHRKQKDTDCEVE